uniref:Uncharacterized protein n=1 Tax=Romanomermis culicivorax TaxID=13658 RepID=A0A915HFZ9_ROMCU
MQISSNFSPSGSAGLRFNQKFSSLSLNLTLIIRKNINSSKFSRVNYTYQFLRKKFYVFSQFLFDDHIKSRLTKDSRYYRENKEKLNGIFPFERAEKFVRSIRKLGTTIEGYSYLDEFRRLITQIGNALGYVRLIKSGGQRSCAESIQFLINDDDQCSNIKLSSFYQFENQENLCSKLPAEKFDSFVDHVTKSFASSAEYFKLLVDVFTVEFRDQKHIHLKNFYVIIPALTISYVEHITQCKERLNKKNLDNAAISDDGFAMGRLAYILKLLDQYVDFDSLQWFKAVNTKYNKDQVSAYKPSSLGRKSNETSSTDDEKLLQTLNLTKKRLDQYSREFDLLNFALRSARIFFRTDVSVELIALETGEKSSSEKNFIASLN